MSFDLTLVIEEDMPPNVLSLVVDGEDVTIQLSPRLERSALFVLNHDLRDKTRSTARSTRNHGRSSPRTGTRGYQPDAVSNLRYAFPRR